MRTLFCAALSAAVVGCQGQALDPSLLPQQGSVLLVSEPAGAAFLPAGSTTVRGTAIGLSDVMVAGRPATVDGDAFEAEVELHRGIETIEVSGVDEDGHTLFRRLSVMAGDFGPADGAVEDGAAIRVNEGGLDAATELAGGLFDVQAINDSLTALNPVYEDSYSLLGWEAVEVVADIGEVRFDPPRITLDPSGGAIDAEIELPDLFVSVPVRGSIVGIDFDVECTIEADAVVITGSLPIGTDGDGHLTADLTGAGVALQGFFFDTTLLPGEVDDWLLGDAIEGVLTDLLVDKISTMVPPLLEEQLATLELAFDTELFGKDVSIAAGFSRVVVDQEGLELSTDIAVEIPGDGRKSSPGYLLSGGGLPRPPTAPDLSVALSDDLMNRLLHDVWRSGMLDLVLATDDGSLDPAMLAAIGAGEGSSITLAPKLPPVLLQDGAQAVLELGELDVILETPGGTKGDRLVLTLAGAVPVDLEIEDSALTLALGAPDVTIMVRESDWGASEETITRMFEQELPIDALLLMLGALEVPLPTIGDLEIPDAHVGRDASGTCTTIEIEL